MMEWVTPLAMVSYSLQLLGGSKREAIWNSNKQNVNSAVIVLHCLQLYLSGVMCCDTLSVKYSKMHFIVRVV